MRNETPLAKKRRARKIFRVLGEVFPYAHAELDYTNAFELLVATVLSAQTTDIRVNAVTPALFERFPDAFAMAQASEVELQELIRSTGFYKNKARALLGLSQALIETMTVKSPVPWTSSSSCPESDEKQLLSYWATYSESPALPPIPTSFG